MSLYSCPTAKDRCPVFLLDLYFSKMPAEDVSKEIFFFKPVMFIPELNRQSVKTC